MFGQPKMNTNEMKPMKVIPVADGGAGAEAKDTPTPIKVWLVDDDDEYRTLLAESLTRHRGIECPRNFRSADAAVSTLASKAGPDVLLLDIQMRGQNGLDAVGPIKTLSRSTRVLMLTTFYDEQNRSRALEEGASGLLLKTDSLDKIVQRIRKPEPVGQAQGRRRRKRACRSLAVPLPQTSEAKPSRADWWRRFSRVIGFPA
jgi:CheY-like chemotaxis protein